MRKPTPDQFGACPYVTAQKLLQGKWSILVMHHLSSGPRRFNELQRLMPNLTHSTLSSQLKLLEGEGLVVRTVYPEVPLRVEYSLTDIGAAFHPVLDCIETWGNEYIQYLGKREAATTATATTMASA
ncbi:MAG: winged helix-turn-helix transcriptional regulator [Atopobiaceae bacterium]